MRNRLQFPKSQDGRDRLLAAFWIAAVLGIGIATNCLALARYSAAGSEAFLF